MVSYSTWMRKATGTADPSRAVRGQRQGSLPSLFGPLRPLPRGPHQLAPAEVAASQRARLLAAVTNLVAEDGYEDTTIAAIARRAGVSPNVFYLHFDSKLACYLSAYDVFAAAVAGALNGAAHERPGLSYISAGLQAYLALLDVHREATRAFLVEVATAGPQARTHIRKAMRDFASLLQRHHEEMRSQDQSLGSLPGSIFLGLVYGIRALVCESVEDKPNRPLACLHHDLVTWVEAIARGAPRPVP